LNLGIRALRDPCGFSKNWGAKLPFRAPVAGSETANKAVIPSLILFT